MEVISMDVINEQKSNVEVIKKIRKRLSVD